MAKLFSVRDWNRTLKELKKGETFYFNLIACTENAVIKFIADLKAGVIKPDPTELIKHTSDSATFEDYMNGTYQFPQMTYVKQ